jgi:hypothetical protein
MQGIKTTSISILVVGLLAGSAFGVTAQDDVAGSEAGEPLPAGPGPLEPATYTDSSLGQTLTFTVGEGWSIGGEAVEGVGVDLFPEPFNYGGPEGKGFLGITRSDGVVFESFCVPAGGDYAAFNDARTSIEPTAQALAEHLAANPYLETTEPVEIEIAGYSGVQLDGTAIVGEDCDPPRTMLWAIPEFDSWTLADGDHARYHFIDAGGEVVAIVLEASADVDLDELAALAAPVIESMVLEPLPE